MHNIILQNSSQPYLYNANNEQYLLYCFSNDTIDLVFGSSYSIRPWKIKCKNLSSNQNYEINTPQQHSEHGNVVLECNPHVNIVNNNVYLNYVAGFNLGPNQPIHYYICSVSFTDLTFTNRLDDQINIIKKTFTGYIHNDYLYYNSQYKFNGKIMRENINTGKQIEITSGFAEISHMVRMSKIYDQNYFLITGYDINQKFMSILVDQNFNFVKYIRNQDNEDIYKCTILDNRLIYTVRDDSDPDAIEKRYLVEESYNI